MRRRITMLAGLAAIMVVLAACLVLLAVWSAGGTDEGAEAHPGPVIVGFDMGTGGNSCPYNCTDGGAPERCTTCPTYPNCDCSLGTIDRCVETTAGATILFDVYLEGLPSGASILGMSYAIDTWPGKVWFRGHGDATVNLIAQPGSETHDYSDLPGDAPPPFLVDVRDEGYAEYSPLFTHGVLGRYGLSLEGVAPGLYGLTLTDVTLTEGLATRPADLCVDFGCTILDANYEPQYGLIAVDTTCPAGVTPAPPPTPTPHPPTPTPMTWNEVTIPAKKWGNFVWTGDTASPEEVAHCFNDSAIAAMYRLDTETQEFERWFPDGDGLSNGDGLSDGDGLSTMGDIAPLDVLLALNASDEPGTCMMPDRAAPSHRGVTIPARSWANFAWTGDTASPEEVFECFASKIVAMYRLDAETQRFEGWFLSHGEASTMGDVAPWDVLLAFNASGESATCMMDGG